jgi:DNA-binding NarL/FixJ family response regulator
MALRVFLVEDLASMRSWIAEVLGTLRGYELAGMAASEAEANAWLREHPAAWDLAIVDLVLEQGAGFSVIRCARELGAGATIAVFSSYVSADTHAHCMRLGADAVFDKSDQEGFIAWLRERNRS